MAFAFDLLKADELIYLFTHHAFSELSFRSAFSSTKQRLGPLVSFSNQLARFAGFFSLVLTDSQFRFTSTFLLKNRTDALKQQLSFVHFNNTFLHLVFLSCSSHPALSLSVWS